MVLGVDQSGKDTKSLIQINVQGPSEESPSKEGAPPVPEPQDAPIFKQIDYSHLKPTDVIVITTGYARANMWLEWLAAEAREHMKGSFVACAAARLNLYTEPGPVHPEDKDGYRCLMGLTREAAPENCLELATVYPLICNNKPKKAFTPVRGPPHSYPCYDLRTLNKFPINNYGVISPDWCNHMLKLDTSEVGQWARSDLFWLCGTGLHVRLRAGATAVCALVRLVTPVSLSGTR